MKIQELPQKSLTPPPSLNLSSRKMLKSVSKKSLSRFCALAFASFVFCGTACFAEISGGFVGAYYGYGEFRQVSSGTFGLGGTPIATGATRIKADSFSTGVSLGYKHFFNHYVGLRLYGEIGVYVPEFRFEGEVEDATLVNYGASLDLLVNFIAKPEIDFGIFIGGGVGANTWISKEIEQLKKDIREYGLGFRVNDTRLDVALNAGVRFHFARRHGIELGSRVPFYPAVVLNENLYEADASINLKIEYVHIYNVFVRYTFRF